MTASGSHDGRRATATAGVAESPEALRVFVHDLRPAVALQPLREPDLPFAAALHAALLPHGFFGRLGHPFLRTYYGTFLDSPHAVALLSRVDGRRVGVLVGTLDNRAHYAWVSRHRLPHLALAGLVGLATHPAELRLFLRTRLRRYLRGLARWVARGRAPRLAEAAPAPLPCIAVLTHVAVAEDARGRGAGRQLVDAFLDAAHRAGAGEARLVTLADGDGAGAFYQRTGWRHLEDHANLDGLRFATYARPLR